MNNPDGVLNVSHRPVQLASWMLIIFHVLDVLYSKTVCNWLFDTVDMLAWTFCGGCFWLWHTQPGRYSQRGSSAIGGSGILGVDVLYEHFSFGILWTLAFWRWDFDMTWRWDVDIVSSYKIQPGRCQQRVSPAVDVRRFDTHQNWRDPFVVGIFMLTFGHMIFSHGRFESSRAS